MDSGEGLNRDRIINDFNSMLETSDINDTSETANYNKPDPISDGSGDPPSGDGVIIANESKIEGSSKYDNYSQPHEEIKRISKLAAEGKAMLSDIQKRDELIELHRDADSKLSQMPEYKNLQSKFLQKQNEIKKYQDKYFTNKDGRLHRNVNASGHFVEINLNKLKNELNTISEKRSKIKNDAWNKSSKVINTYDYIPTTVAEGNAVQESFYGVGNVLSNTNNIGQLLDISEIYDTNSGKFSNITSNHRDTLTKVLNTADPKSFTISKPTPSGANGKPQVTITFTPKKGSSKYEIDNMEGWDKSIGGEDGTISFVATLKSKKGSKHASEISSLSNFITSRYEGKGENIISGAGAGLPQGTHLSQSMDYNTYRGYDMNEMYNEAFIENRSNNTVQIRDKVAYKILAGKASSKDMTIPQYIAKYGKEKI